MGKHGKTLYDLYVADRRSRDGFRYVEVGVRTQKMALHLQDRLSRRLKKRVSIKPRPKTPQCPQCSLPVHPGVCPGAVIGGWSA